MLPTPCRAPLGGLGVYMPRTVWRVEKEGCCGWDALEVEAESWEGKAFELGDGRMFLRQGMARQSEVA